MIASHMLRMQPARAMFVQSSRRMMSTRKPPKKSTLEAIKSVPAELWPLGAVLGAAIVFAGYSLGAKLMSDQTLRLKRQGPAH